ncbi:hypothetical protein L226DRAFT_68940 [Lentinus tigrinus ALCF2SS1-7]|uniref:uncharacterized protein n=1 Tax=Lentinus tigrinus ALCF2SS1-7 TaxID=1328758 RepID=UPI001165CAE4|nr:hypothetical protein L226DRAFT_68940 [Lentinus tigrinus ALCF2SS1-7]
MGQYWEIFNISRRQVGEIEGRGLKFGEFFFVKQDFLVRSLTIPFESPELLAYYDLVPKRRYENGLLSLPDELLLEIIAYARRIATLWDVACFAITCRKMLILSRDSLNYDRAVEAAPWYSCRIACIGDYATVDDLPDQIMNAAQRAQLKKLNEKDSNEESDEESDGESYAGLYSYMIGRTVLFHGAFALPKEAQRHFSRGDQALYRAALSLSYPNRDDWALFNVTKEVYVRASALAELAGKPSDPQPFLPSCRVDLGHALLIRIAWSSDGSLSMRTDIDIHRGPWAGDRFFISTMDKPPPCYKALTMKGWRDVSEEIVRDLKEIYNGDAEALGGPVFEQDEDGWEY